MPWGGVLARQPRRERAFVDEFDLAPDEVASAVRRRLSSASRLA